MVSYAGSLRREARVHTAVMRFCAQSSGSIAGEFHTAVRCCAGPQRGFAVEPDHRSNFDQLRQSRRHNLCGALCRPVAHRNPPLRAGHFRGLLARADLRASRGVQRENAAVSEAAYELSSASPRSAIAEMKSWQPAPVREAGFGGRDSESIFNPAKSAVKPFPKTEDRRPPFTCGSAPPDPNSSTTLLRNRDSRAINNSPRASVWLAGQFLQLS